MLVLAHFAVADTLSTFLQVFGGCCCNVYILEGLLSHNLLPYSLTYIITFLQFAFVALLSYYPNCDVQHSSWYKLYLRRSRIPLRSLAVLVLMFFSTSILNNLVLKFNISIPLHIVFRSSGTVVTMVVGYFFGKKTYNYNQIMSSVVISLGTILTTLQSFSLSQPVVGTFDSKFAMGVLILITTAILSAFMGLYNESLVKIYGNQWRENLFYSHFLALPLFLIVSPQLKNELDAIIRSPEQVEWFHIHIPAQLVRLGLVVVTQYICIRGVNRLTGQMSSLSVTVVLLVRKCLSLLISVMLFGNSFNVYGIIGACMVFGGAIQYSLAGQKPTSHHKRD